MLGVNMKDNMVDNMLGGQHVTSRKPKKKKPVTKTTVFVVANLFVLFLFFGIKTGTTASHCMLAG